MTRLLTAFLLLFPVLLAADEREYDPLKTNGGEITSTLFGIRDEKRDRDIPIRVYLPENTQAVPLVLFSHGLGGSRDNNPYLGTHWARRGYLSVFLQHPGSDEEVWKTAPPPRRRMAMGAAASLENHLARIRDVSLVIDTLTIWNADENHPLHNRLDPTRIGMSGHSFGALTTQAVAGQATPGKHLSFHEPRLTAAVMMSPSPPSAGDPAAAFSAIEIPCLLMTGTRDDSPIGNTTPAGRLKVFPHLAKAPAWQIVFDEANHMDFGQRSSHRETRYHRAILGLTSAFWDAHLNQNPDALAWLNGKGAESLLKPADTWEANPRAKKSPQKTGEPEPPSIPAP